MSTEKTLTETLKDMGLTHRPAKRQFAREIVDGSGAVLFTGNALQTWAWLRETGRLP